MALDSLLCKVSFYRYNNGTNDDFNPTCIMSYFDVKNYKMQGKMAKRKVSKRICKCSEVLG